MRELQAHALPRELRLFLGQLQRFGGFAGVGAPGGDADPERDPRRDRRDQAGRLDHVELDRGRGPEGALDPLRALRRLHHLDERLGHRGATAGDDLLELREWFGGGADLNPCIEYAEDTAHFHGQMQEACDAHDPAYFPKFKAWADEYFFVPHRGRARGVGGIFYDDLNTGDWDADFAFTRDVGAHFLPAFVPLTERRVNTPWTDDDREAQLVHRGLYAEYNLVYDRGTKFGLETGHDANAVLMSLPPIAKWT